MAIPLFTVLFGMLIWMGFDRTFGFAATGFEKLGWKSFRQTAFWRGPSDQFQGIGKEFMPSLNEGSFLLMPTSMSHSGVEQNLKLIESVD